MKLGSDIGAWYRVLAGLEALSLDTGLPMTGVEEMRFFCHEAIEYKLRVY